MFKKFAIATVLVALVMGIGSAFVRSEPKRTTAAPAALTTTGGLEPIHGLKPLSEIVELWEGRVEAQPLDYLSRTQLGVALSSQARETADLDTYADAEKVLRDALTINGDYEPARLGLASVLIAQHEFAAAAMEAAAVLESDPRSLPALALVGDARFELGEYDEASRVYLKLIAMERSAPTVSRLARLSFVEGRSERAVTLAVEAVELSEELALRPSAHAFYWFQLGHFQFKGGDVDGSIASYRQALRIDPAHPGASEGLAFVLAAAGRNTEAAAVYRELIERSPAADLHGLYADVLRTLGDDDEAERQERLGEELAAATIGRYPAERRHLVGFYLTRDPELAVELAEADAATRNDVGAHDTLAWALHHVGRPVEATDAIEKALAVGTRDPDLLYHAGAIRAAAGDVAAAREYLESALAINPRFHPTDAAKARELLADLRTP